MTNIIGGMSGPAGSAPQAQAAAAAAGVGVGAGANPFGSMDFNSLIQAYEILLLF